MPFPDSIILSAFEALLAGPQRNGTPLPRLLLGFERAQQAGFLGMGITLVATGQFGAALLYGGLAASLTSTCPEESDRLGKDAREWSPRRAALYRALACHGIETGTRYRMLALLSVLVATALLVGLMRDGAEEAIACAAALLVLSTAHAARSYAACVMPSDPDAPAPHGASAGA